MQEHTGRMIHVSDIMYGPNKKEPSISDLPKLPPKKQEDTKMAKFQDVRRIELITRVRENTQKYRDMMKKQGGTIKTTMPPLKHQPSISSLANLKPLVLEDIDLQKDAVYKGYFLYIKIMLISLIFATDVLFHALYWDL